MLMMKILLADDERNFGMIFKNELEGDGHTVDLVFDGVEAVEKYIDGRHEFLLFDIKMPRLDGINALRIIKKLDPAVPGIIFSGNAGSGEMAESMRAGALRCFTKPFEISQIIEEIQKYLQRRR
jgi:two-component system response regulator AtoC